MQRASIAAFCERRGWACEWYEDAEGHSSGRTEQGRGDWLRLKARIGDPDVIAVVGFRLDRLARSVKDIASLLDFTHQRGVGVVTADGMIDTTNQLNAWTAAQINMTAVFAQLESDMARDRMKDLVAAKDRAGVNHGRSPFGMSRVGDGTDARFTASPDVASVIRCLELYAGGASYDQCAARLNRDAIPFRDRKGNVCEWGRESVRTVVGNTLRYAGYHVPQEGYDAKANRVALDAGEGDYVDRWARALKAWRSPAVDQVIDRVLANAVIERRLKNQYTGRPAGTQIFLLTPIAYWQGRRLRGQSRIEGRRYRTYGHGIALDADEVERAFLLRVADLNMTDEIRAGVRQVIAARMSEARIGLLHAKLNEAKEARSVLLDLLLSKAISREDYNAQFAHYERIIRDIESDMRSPSEVEIAMARLSDVGRMILITTAERQKKAIHSIFAKIALDDDGEICGIDWQPMAQVIWSSLRPRINDHEAGRTNVAEGGATRQGLYVFPARIDYWVNMPAA